MLIGAAGARDTNIDSANGIVRGFDARTGALKWEFDPIPPQYSDKTGAANVWTPLSADPARGLVFLATTSPSPDFYGLTRAFDIPMASAVVSVETGEPVWHYQLIRHDLFDYDLPNHPLLVTIRKDGRLRDVAIQISKTGMIYVLDRDTGEPVFPIDEYRAPASALAGEKAAPFQPVPRLREAVSPLALRGEDAFGLTPLDRAWCRRRIAGLRNEGVLTPPSMQESLTYPSAMGGPNWGSTAYDPNTNLLIVRSDNIGSTIAIRPKTEGDGAPATFQTRDIPGTDLQTSGDYLLSPLGIPCAPPPWGTLSAIDMNSGHIVWQVPLGNAHRFGITVPASFHWGSPGVGGPLVTAGGLIFIGATLDGELRALDIRTGREMWSDELPAPGMSVPVSYALDGKQFVALTAGGNAFAGTNISDAIVAYRLAD